MIAQAFEIYNKALKQGQKQHKDCVLHGRYPYPQVLDEILMDSMISGQHELGLVEVPSELIIGTKAPGRKVAFSADFMPLMDVGTEFATKWMELCSAHLEEGIREPVKCYEYLGRFYIQEGNKRVSVLKALGALSIPCDVIRILPTPSEDPEIQLYSEFLQFYQLSKIYDVHFRKFGAYRKLQAALGFEPNHVWTSEERKAFLSRFARFRSVLEKMDMPEPVSASDALLVWLQVYSMEKIRDLGETELTHNLKALWDDILVQARPDPIEVNTTHTDDNEKGIINRILGAVKVTKLKIAFINQRNPEDSPWTYAHDLGRQYLEQVLGSRVSVRVYNMRSATDDAELLMEEAVADGAKVIFATTTPLITACRKIALKYPNLYVLNCSVSMPFTGVRTYYSRIFEGKFITGAIAGAMTDTDEIGYVASYPILGVPASINAFALGAQMTNPRAKVVLHWSCTPGNCQDVFTRKGIHVISNRDIPTASHDYGDMGTYQVCPDGKLIPLASPYWDWGRFYEKVVRQILDGLWDSGTVEKKAVNYWWGMRSGVIDVKLSDELPAGVRQMADILRRGFREGTVDPFFRQIVSQDGTVRNDGTHKFTADEVLNMDWLCSNVVGSIPSFDQILPMSQSIVRLLGIYRDDILPEKGAAIL